MVNCNLVLLLFINVLCPSNSFGPNPRIISSGGHLIFNSAENKDIHFVSKGKGKILLNNGDLTDAAALARNASDTLNRITSEYSSTNLEVQRLKKAVEGHDGILNRLTILETGAVPMANVSPAHYDDYTLSVINQRLRNLQRKVNRLTLLLTKNECSSNPCKNGGTCQDLFNGYLCQCPVEWEGPLCDKDVNECSRFAGTDLGCQNGATCVNKPGSYECICPNGWFGLHCTRQTNSCTSGSATELCGHGICVPQGNSYKCICDQGWTTDGTNPACIKDVDECNSTKIPCSTNPPVPCINVPGTFYCGSCPQGYTGNGYHCADLDECAVLNGGCSVNPLVTCINTPGSRVCGHCPPGYIGDGTSCSFHGVCGVNNGGCHHLAQCRDNPRISSTYVECICPAAYAGSGIGPNGCVRTLDGVDPCAINPCLHGTCVTNNVTGTYVCQCNRRYTGTNCDIRKDPCQPNPCQNGGTCRSIADLSFRCVCTTAFTGDTCDKERQACGGQLRGVSGTLKYPATHSTVYAHQISCAWIIQTNSTKVLNITFTNFHLEGSSNCRFDWLQIHDGRNSAAHSLGRFCGNTLPNGGTIISSHNVIYLWFRSDPSLSSSGFELNWDSIDPECGGTFIVTSHGTIRSPGFPGNYPPNRDCYWSLQAPMGKRFQFHFFSLMIGNNTNCSYDFLSFYEGYSTSNQLLKQFCSTDHPEPLYSSGFEVLIHFHSDATRQYSGFQVAYSVVEGIPGCGGVFTANLAEIGSPTIEGQYPPNLMCEYRIQVTEKSRIKLTFLSFSLEEDDDCSYDFVEIHEGLSTDSPTIGRYCGSHIPPSYLSSGNEILVVFNSDWGSSEEGFRLKYETICGGVFSEPFGVLESPGYPSRYKEDHICIYEIMQPLGTSIYLEFVDFDVEGTSFPDCIFDFVEIRDGDNENSTLVGTYCGEVPPPSVQSTYNYLWLKFETDSSVSSKGFQANYTTSNMGCGGILKSNAGMIKSPEHPYSYPADATCTWIIVAPPGNVIQLSWLLFQLEETTSCLFDYVEVYNNHTNNELIGKYCGLNLPPTLISSTNTLTIKFVSDSSVSFDGFMATYAFVDEMSACGGRYFASSGVIKSPFYPEEYPPNRECTWIITVNSGSQIMLNVTDFALESFSSCNYDYLEIRNGGSATSPLVGRFCASKIPKQIPSHANQLYLYFKSDMSLVDRGFEITWNSAATGCGGILTSPKGAITSPYYPEPYGEDTECEWRISVSAGSIIQIVFADLDLEGHVQCELDYIEIFDGPNMLSKSLGKFCFAVNVPFIRSSTNHVTVKFVSDYSVNARGFHIQYNTVCQNTLKGFRGVIESPNFPNGYPQDQDCTWRIEVPSGNKINITFTHFELERSDFTSRNNCSFDYLEIKYSERYTEYQDDHNFLKYGTYCGSDVPQLITIASNIAEIHFVTDSLLIGSGFRLEWQHEGCGGTLTHPSGSFSTPNYPNGYPEDTQCDWVIQTDYGSSIEVTFTELDFEPSSSCYYDYVLVTNGPDETYPMLTKLCSKGKKSLVVTSTGNYMFVRFQSDYSYHGKGFWANYTTVPTKCGGKLSTSVGAFHSPNYPKNYDVQDTCEWLIDVEDNHVIELNFEEVDLSGDCATNYIKIYDGPSTAYPIASKICGTAKPNSTIRSTYNHMIVEMRTDAEYTAKGFLANYSLGCGARIETESSGLITISDLTLASTSFEDCSWTIVSANPSRHVTLIITHMDWVECYSDEDGIKIYNGESNKSPLIERYCDNKLPPPIYSTGHALHIELSVTSNFAAKYSMLDTACGGTLTGSSGYFATPKYPNTYPVNVECEWTVQVAPGNQIMLSFNSFELVSSQNCYLDYLEIREGDGHGKLLGTFCDTIPTNITNEGNLWLLFKSSKPVGDDSGASAKGFLAEYVLNHGIDLNGPSGKIASPLYPNYYFGATEFTWRVTVQFGMAVSVTFVDFYVEVFEENDCSLSYLEIFDGFDDRAPSLNTLCGVMKPEPIVSSSNVIFIKMKYDSVRHGSKFLLEWMEVDGSTLVPGLPKPKVKGCGSEEIIHMSNTTVYNLTSPGYPYGYTENLECEWVFSTLPGYHIVIDFLKVDVENFDGNCGYDTITVYNGKDGKQNWEQLAQICLPNATQDNEMHGSNLMKLEFRTDSYTNGSGFEARIRKECGGPIEAPNGIISVDVLEFRYRQSCKWNVTVRPGKTIKVTFLQLNIASNRATDVCDNYVLLKNGHFPNSPMLGIGKYCNNSIPQPLETTGNLLYVKFTGYPKKGFKLKFEEKSKECGGEIILSQFDNKTHISSPNYPNIPPPYTECYWRIMGPPGESLRIDFEERFDVTRSIDCELAGVELRDGGSKYSPLLGTFCSGMPNSTFTTDNVLYVKFYTNVEDPRNGFKASVTLTSCGGVIRSTSGQIHSPNFNNTKMFPRNINCVWKIIGPHDHYLIFKFNTLDLEEPTADCLSVDHVSLEERFPFNMTDNSLGDYCGNMTGSEITSSNNEVTVRFVTGNAGSLYAGFSLSFNSSRESCGGTLNAESGIIQSPGYPVSNHNNRECEWIIKVPEGRRITLQFIDLNIELNGYDQGLAFFNDDGYLSHITYMHELNTSVPIKSSANTMCVVFWGINASRFRGFRARYSSDEPSICTGSFKGNSGTLRNVNESLYYCTWSHELGMAKTLAMKFVVQLSEGEPHSCDFPGANLIIRRSYNGEKDILLQFCRTLTHPTTVIVRSPYPTTEIIAFQDKSTKNLRYTIDYQTYPCGGVTTTQEDFITSPGFPNKYSSTVECSWLIKLSSDQRIKVNFTNFNFDSNCEYNYLVVYNGDLPTSPKIGHFCQNNKPTFINSQSNNLLIEYHSDEKSSGTGFKLNYEPISDGCGGVFHDSARLIETPSYPKDYPNNAECLWEIMAPNGYHISLEFIDRFYIEQAENCKNDFMEVWDYKNEEFLSLGTQCGRDTPVTINSTSNRMRILFRSNDKITAAGFKARWSTHCGGSFEATKMTQYIVSPGYPSQYANNLNCTYKIMNPNSFINVVFEEFNLEQEPSCNYDNVSIQTIMYYGNQIMNSDYPKIYCGTRKPPPIHQQDGVIIQFVTDSWITHWGFKLYYKLDDCGGVITEPTMISSPALSDQESYVGSLRCTWNITAPKDKNVVVRFISFELEHNIYCTFDYVALYDGLYLNDTTRLALLCGNISRNLPVIKSRSNSMTVQLVTDHTNNFAGFKALVYFNYGPSMGCGGVINVDGSTTIGGPPGLSNLDCQWEISTKNDKMLKIRFTELNLLPCTANNTIGFGSKNCSCNLLEIRDGAGPFSQLIDEICDNTIPPEFTTSGHTAWLRLYTMDAHRNRPFVAIITEVASICGPRELNVTNQTQVLTSPLYPDSYPNNIKCTWMLSSSEYMSTFDLHFLDFDLLEVSDKDFVSKKCTSDRLEITDNSNMNVIAEGLGTATVFSGIKTSSIYGGYKLPVGVHQYCGRHALSFDYYSGENQVAVSFYSTNNQHGKGFKMEYRLAGCNRNYTSTQGRLQNSQVKDDCVITITVPTNYTISLYFLSFMLFDVDSCQSAGFEVYDGASKSGTQIAKVCGYSLPNPIFSNGNQMYIHVWNNNDNSLANFDVVYTSTDAGKGCGGTFYNYAGVFTSPLHPLNYRKDSTCTWEIYVPQGTEVALKFNSFDINGSCETDYIIITTYNLDGTVPSSHRFCNEDNPATLRSENNHMTVEYVTTANNGGTGWAAQFLAVTSDTKIDWLY